MNHELVFTLVIYFSLSSRSLFRGNTNKNYQILCCLKEKKNSMSGSEQTAKLYQSNKIL